MAFDFIENVGVKAVVRRLWRISVLLLGHQRQRGGHRNVWETKGGNFKIFCSFRIFCPTLFLVLKASRHGFARNICLLGLKSSKLIIIMCFKDLSWSMKWHNHLTRAQSLRHWPWGWRLPRDGHFGERAGKVWDPVSLLRWRLPSISEVCVSKKYQHVSNSYSEIGRKRKREKGMITISSFPFIAAIMSGVSWNALAASTSAWPTSNNKCATSLCPFLNDIG